MQVSRKELQILESNGQIIIKNQEWMIFDAVDAINELKLWELTVTDLGMYLYKLIFGASSFKY